MRVSFLHQTNDSEGESSKRADEDERVFEAWGLQALLARTLFKTPGVSYQFKVNTVELSKFSYLFYVQCSPTIDIPMPSSCLVANACSVHRKILSYPTLIFISMQSNPRLTRLHVLRTLNLIHITDQAFQLKFLSISNLLAVGRFMLRHT